MGNKKQSSSLPKPESWGTRIGLILAMAGNAVGLGNFLRFPVQAVENGGGAFIIPYLVCFLLMGIPLLWIEWTMGRYGGKFGNHSTPFILDEMTKRKFWKYFGVFGIFTNIAVASYYCYIESWTMSYVYHSLVQTFDGMTQGQVAAFFDNYIDVSNSTTGIPYEAVIFYIICLSLNIYILSRGLQKGVEKAAMIGMPLLILFGIILAIRGITLGDSGAPAGCTDCNAALGLNFLWEPQFSSLADPKVWLAAAGQIFFTLSVGMGTIQCYAAYVRSKDDIALNAMSAGWMNGFVEVVLGASIVIPIAAGYLGLQWVQENAGFAMAFQTMPFLFMQWGDLFGTLAGVFWFGLLFFAGITSSLAMGTPWMGFMRDEFKWTNNRSAISFGFLTLAMGLPCIFFYNEGVFGEYDYWAGTVSLVVFALAETIIFSWIFGINNSWRELNEGADIIIPRAYKAIMTTITPLLLLIIFAFSLATPAGNDWGKAWNEGYELDEGSIIGRIMHKGVTANRAYFSDHFESEVAGIAIIVTENEVVISASQAAGSPILKTYSFGEKKTMLIREGQLLEVGTPIAEGTFINNIFYVDMSRFLMMSLFIFLCILVFRASQLREKRKL
ncbi:MAG: sodium-dependent transporter [Bacteroidia bacterium]